MNNLPLKRRPCRSPTSDTFIGGFVTMGSDNSPYEFDTPRTRWLRLGSSRAKRTFRTVTGGGRRRRFCITLALFAPMAAHSQEPSSNLGLPAVGAFGVHVGTARLERHSTGPEGGFLLDLGWMRGRSVRLQGEIAMLSASLNETLLREDSTLETFSGDYFALSAGLSAIWLVNRDGQVSPYALAGVAVHAMSSAFRNPVLDARYNANRFGSHIGGGVRYRLGSRTGLYAEARRIIADEVDRTVIRVGALALFGDLYRR
jgi:hypothetical protein